jgi:hypothetical protein
MQVSAIVDTNVEHAEVSSCCVAECALRLQRIMRQGRIVLDDSFRILNEYQKKTQPRRGKGPGDAFVKWALRNNSNKKYCDQVNLQVHAERIYSSFPDDSKLIDFDLEDRKFVAVAVVHPKHPPIYEAADSKWLDWAPVLKGYGILVEFICKDDIKRFHEHKFGKK